MIGVDGCWKIYDIEQLIDLKNGFCLFCMPDVSDVRKVTDNTYYCYSCDTYFEYQRETV